jgi:hypothetical protein
MVTNWRAWLTWPRVLVLAIGLGLLCSANAVLQGFTIDDCTQIVAIERTAPSSYAHYDLYNFNHFDPAPGEFDFSPWWMSPHFRLVFLRPLSSALLVSDHALFGRSPFGYHIHSLLWYGALIAVAGALYRRVLPGGWGAVALFLYAVAHGHSNPVAWIANRYGLISTAAGCLAVLMHVLSREGGGSRHRLLSLLALTTGLCAGETALGAFGYLIAYEAIAKRTEPLRGRVLSLTPALAVGALYLVVYKWARCGAAGSDALLDPMVDPVGYLEHAWVRALMLSGDMLWGIPSNLWWSGGRIEWVLGTFGAFGLACVIPLSRSLFASTTIDERRGVAWLTLGGVLAVIPALGAMPGSRLLIFAGVGGSAFLAFLVCAGWRQLVRIGGDRTINGIARRVMLGIWGLLTLLHGLISPLVFPFKVWILGQLGRHAYESACTMPEYRDEPRGTHVFELTGVPNWPLGHTRMAMCPSPGGIWTISIAPHPARIARTSMHTLHIEMIEGEMLTSNPESLVRSARFLEQPGDVIRRGPFEVRIDQVGERGPRSIDVIFDRELEDPSYRFLVQKAGHAVVFRVPPVGASVEVEAPAQWSL